MIILVQKPVRVLSYYFKKILHNSLTVIKTLNSYIKYVSKVYKKTVILVPFILN